MEQHLFDVHGSGGQSSEDSESGTSSASSNVSARQRRRHHKEQEEARRNRDMYEPDFFVLESVFKSTRVMSSYQGNATFWYERNLWPELKVQSRLQCLCRALWHQSELGDLEFTRSWSGAKHKNLGGLSSQVFNYSVWNWLLTVFAALVEIPKQLALLPVTFFR